jgi:transmembrane sensor
MMVKTSRNMSLERTQEIEEAASAWLIRRDSGVWSDDDQRQFHGWLTASTLHRVAFLRLEATWEDAARLKALGAGVPGDQPPSPAQWNLSPFFEPREPPASVAQAQQADAGRPHTWLARWRTGLAAAAVLAVGIGAYLALTSYGERYATPVGRIESVAVADGSRVTLNTNSEIRVQLTPTERRVDLDKGEAFFAVAKDPKRPFVVAAGDKRVIAVGTQFSVRREGTDVQVVVTEGQVRMVDGGETLLTPGTIARAGESGVLVQRKSLTEAEEQLSWRSGVLRFRDQTLGEAVAEFNRYNERKIIIADSKVAALKIEGNFRATNVDAFVRLLESGFPVRATTDNGEIVLTANEAVTR